MYYFDLENIEEEKLFSSSNEEEYVDIEDTNNVVAV